VSQREPQRLAQQIKPQSIEVLSPKEAEQLAATMATPRTPQCLQTGLFDDAQVTVLRRVLDAALPQGTWILENATLPARWIVYMGKYANAAELDKKRSQLDGMHLTFEPLTNSALAPGLSLGVFQTQGDANAALEALMRRGVRTARVLQEQPPSSGYRLRLPNADENLRKQLVSLKTALTGKVLVPC
jgi:hypothetical protein